MLAPKKLKEVLQTKLEEFEMTPSDLERKAGLSASSIRKLLNLEAPNPTLETLLAIAEVFKCSIDELVGKRIGNFNDQFSTKLSNLNIVFNGVLMQKIVENTSNYLKKQDISDNNFKFNDVMNFIVETYNYCVVKKDGQFDENFHEWHIQKIIDSIK